MGKENRRRKKLSSVEKEKKDGKRQLVEGKRQKNKESSGKKMQGGR